MGRRTISMETLIKIKNELPEYIINMLPDSPENLLKYATRVKEIQVSKDINKETAKLMKEFLLNDEEYLKTFYYTMAISFYGKKAIKSPCLSVVAAQTGSGKSNLTALLLRENPNFIFVDSDKYKHFRYDAINISNTYPILYPALTGPDAYDHAENIYRYALENKFNIIKETAPSKNKSLIDVDIDKLKKNNYTISLNILAVNELNSLLSTHERYELQKIYDLKTAKLTGIHRHDESYNALIPSVKNLLASNQCHNIKIYKRGSLKNDFHPLLIFSSDTNTDNCIATIQNERIKDFERMIKEFIPRYNLLIEQMKSRKAPKEQFQQLNSILERYQSFLNRI